MSATEVKQILAKINEAAEKGEYWPEYIDALIAASGRLAEAVENGSTVQPSPDGRDDLADQVTVLAHHSSIHDGVNIEIDAPAGTRITAALNDWGGLVDVVVPE